MRPDFCGVLDDLQSQGNGQDTSQTSARDGHGLAGTGSDGRGSGHVRAGGLVRAGGDGVSTSADGGGGDSSGGDGAVGQGSAVDVSLANIFRQCTETVKQKKRQKKSEGAYQVAQATYDEV